MRTPRRSRDQVRLSTQSWGGRPPEHLLGSMRRNVTLDCGWGRLILGQTFTSHEDLEKELLTEAPGHRDICLYLRDPHVLISRAPQELFIDPSLTYRLEFYRYRPGKSPIRGIAVRKMQSEQDAEAINRIYAACGMVTARTEVMWHNQHTRTFSYLVAEDTHTGEVVGTVTGINHVNAFSDPEKGSSLWCLAVDPRCSVPGVGRALVRTLVERYQARGLAYLDLSVMHDNRPAIALYEKLGFERVPVFCVKRKNPINEPLFIAPPPEEARDLNPYARIIADEARRRGIAVEILDAKHGYLEMTLGGRRIVTRESLSEMTSAVAMSRCDDKRVTRKALAAAGLKIPRGRSATFDPEDEVFLKDVGEVVVKPARGEQGQGITVGVGDPEGLDRARETARSFCPEVLIEECLEGEDLRIIVIAGRVSAAAIRRPATVVGTGRHSVAALIEAQSRRRAAATGGESRIPVDEATVETVLAAGYEMNEILPEGVELRVRRTANLHTGGTIHDVTPSLSPQLAEAAVRAAEALAIPVVGLDLIVPAVDGPEYVIIEANERPGLANHEPQHPERDFVDLLFPAMRRRRR